MKKTTKDSGFNDGFRSVLPRKKKRSGILENGSGGSETGDTTESESIDMEKKCLVEETSFNYGKGSAFVVGNPNQTPTGSKIRTTKMLSKPLGKINFLLNDNDNDVLLDTLLELPPSVKNLVNISVRKSFALNIGLDKITEKLSQKKLAVSMVLEEAFTPSRFAGIIKVTFTSELSLVQTSKKAEEAKILVNTDLKKSFGHSNRAVVLKEIPIETSTEAVHTALSKFRLIKLIKIQLVGVWQKAVVEFKQINHADLVVAKWSILIRKDIVHVAKSDMNKEL
ncbi:hypothetical protein G9A89_022898 [Geosiphon pyriformis]|nr:hypothetical protein G9A89_022898 [Geosiphon pyriformis]